MEKPKTIRVIVPSDAVRVQLIYSCPKCNVLANFNTITIQPDEEKQVYTIKHTCRFCKVSQQFNLAVSF